MQNPFQLRLNPSLLSKLKDPSLNILKSLSKVEIFQLSLYLCTKPSDERSLTDLQILIKLTEKIEFFKQIQEQNGQQTLQQCLKALTIEQYDQNQVVFHKGSYGTKFYIILKGMVGVYVTNPKQFRGSVILEEDRKTKSQERNKPGSMLKVNEMAQGDSFGELALINDAPRMATIISLSPCIFVVLNKKDFKRIFQQIQEQKLQKEISLLEKVSGFENISRRGLNMFVYTFPIKKYCYREYVYKENEECQDMLYIIRSGMFIVQKSVLLMDDQRMNSQSKELLSLFKAKLNKLIKQKYQYTISQLGVGMIMGDYEVFGKQKYRRTSTQCISQEGEVYAVPLKELKNRIEISNEEYLIQLLKKSSKCKAQWYEEQEKKNRRVMLQNKEYFGKNPIIQESLLNIGKCRNNREIRVNSVGVLKQRVNRMRIKDNKMNDSMNSIDFSDISQKQIERRVQSQHN